MATIKVQAREVLLPVTVLDKHGAARHQPDGQRLHAHRGWPSADHQELYHAEQSALPPGSAGGYQPQRLLRPWTASARPRRKFVDLMLPADPKTAGPRRRGLPDPLRPRGGAAGGLHQLARQAAPRARRDGADVAGAEQSSGARDQWRTTAGTGNRGTARGGTQLYDAIYLASDELMKPKERP